MTEMIDPKIQRLVETINLLGFINTVSCCEGHPDEEVKGFQYAVANVIFAVKDEPRNLFRWYRLMEQILRARQAANVMHDFSCNFDKRFSLGEDDTLCWDWVLKIQGCGRNAAESRAALDEGITFLTKLFQQEVSKTIRIIEGSGRGGEPHVGEGKKFKGSEANL